VPAACRRSRTAERLDATASDASRNASPAPDPLPDVPLGASSAPSRGASPSLDHPQPLYLQVKNHILDRINSGVWGAKARVPSENQLVKAFGVSRMTANRALKELTAEGHLVRLHGVGTFVAERKPRVALLEIRSISDEIAMWGGLHSSVVHLLREETASVELAAAMGIPVGAPIYRSVIVHKDNGRPVQLSDRYVNPSVAPHYLEQDFTRITPNQYLTSVAPIQEAEHVVEAILPDEQTQSLLEVKADEPCLLLHRLTWSFGVVATKSRLIHPGSRYQMGGRLKW
jgi:GntR family histidine utilization transcriptional repressor